ncbi:MAG: 30S ribosomal protein S2 [Candidatus Doudnabacteria bacterium RIFCSPHIGHO2_02_FULL_48_21]|uniref:Small ribosomal subunit protein uS2 n=1 Tax=Candidatus Doudnabacteria bacterium RIFCSPLOWO2_02_FULL_48_13 TaxID=1817845 RepID=A0A1F5QAU5_9BACT|nr:MAG: 30S ribosomal protein S2 [Candidatus Doudnabacteria bacterium RIFCSPHIGHO2_01_48_18]OGE78456.1 MAG: 30S ribosomal protein S2 [Candidatus Doudnabacteria bacterium RIFCSPHIGHO2_01_FULL_48_180]OGE91710.1 MAG: 30S ribosomal protein S2 [Candidatus Doudnabacteria bacterium RIFCSPHIGHO2_12_FULL_47_25]OGE93447.1 MAG: 30S ribosomal protein S2 [Candidatus Doudnabacteria bacterium RIFCSPHIGHO2_02_FULL_48_21]OGE97852.1 MAG: 30S ribosomal protein S2 [Candidatus Doudnabacteria bacterium RIFCSPLOWO2_0
MNYPTLEELLTAGVHFGHLSSRWNPKMSRYIFATRNRIHVINLEKTLEQLKKALDFVKATASAGGQVLFVGTKRQAKDAVKKAAQACGMPYVTIRWLGGTFTNFKTIQKTIKKLERLQKLAASPDFETKYIKKERLLIEREIAKLANLFEGIKDLRKLPEAIFAVDINHDKIAVTEARKTNIKVIGLVDTNSDPEGISYVIPSNDDSIKAISLMCDAVASAINEGKLDAPAASSPQPSVAVPSPARGEGKKENI